MNKLLGIAIGLLLVISVSTGVNAAWGTPFWKFETSGGVVLEIDENGNLNSSGTINGTQLISSVAQGTAPLEVISTTVVANLNASTAADAYNLTCIDCLDGTQIQELTDADISDTLTCSDLVAGTEVVSDTEVENTITIDGGTINLNTNTYSGTLGYGNITTCGSEDQILKISGGAWTCAADDTGTGFGDVFLNETGDIMSGVLNITGNITMADSNSYLMTNQSNSWIYFGTDGSITFHAEA